MFRYIYLVLLILTSFVQLGTSQQYSAARVWNEMVLNSIRGDFARPTVHARNLYHTSLAMYDAFAAYDAVNELAFLGKTTGDFTCDFEGIPVPDNVNEAREMAISFAVYRIIEHRFKDSPMSEDILFNIDLVLSAFGYDRSETSTDYESGNPAALGNYIAEQIIAFGLQDGSNEINDYENLFYEQLNPDLNPFTSWIVPGNNFGNERLIDPNRWQKLDIPDFVDQGGFITPNGVPPFLSPEWGEVVPFALSDADLSLLSRDSNIFKVYHDPGPPSLLGLFGGGTTDDYIWGFSMTALWKTHTIVDSTVMWDISPGSLGNAIEIPETIEDIRAYYNFLEGGDYSEGHEVNPYTSEPYEPQLVMRADYARVLAEFWADGPESETPPGHWFTILNYVNDNEKLIKKYRGEGPVLSDLEWDVKSYLTLGGAMHDAAISAWSCKGYYDYIRPISAIRYMVDRGQSSDPNGLNYNPHGIVLVPGFIEQILEGDPLLAFDNSNLGSIKILSLEFEGQNFFTDARFWLPYQSVNFVTPPFAGYVSGHSTYSRAAAEVLALFTGDPFFPGGLGEFHFEKDRYLSFGTQGPAQDMSLQWATYVDAANQSGLSRIWGGIHPPIDDIPGRRIGKIVGIDAFTKADAFFGTPISSVDEAISSDRLFSVFPNPVASSGQVQLTIDSKYLGLPISISDANGHLLYTGNIDTHTLDLERLGLAPGIYHLSLSDGNKTVVTTKLVVVR